MVCVGLVLAGCAIGPDVRPATVPAPGGGEGVVELPDILPEGVHEGGFVVSVGDGEGEPAAYSLRPVPSEPGRWRLEIEGWRVSELTRAQDGSVLVVRNVDVRERVALDYDPPILLVPSAMAAGLPLEGSSRMRVLDAESGAERDAGDCRWRIELVEPAGADGVFELRTTLRIELRLAVADVGIESSYQAGRGLAGERVDRRTRALGLFPMNLLQHYERID